jgi:hypothetical protein
VRAIGAPEDSAEHLVEHGERGVDENGLLSLRTDCRLNHRLRAILISRRFWFTVGFREDSAMTSE